ncbi:M23 family metallopeptidase [Miltoncostaea marina]|uniref:M23 family metallopeptidase n=1 Tax=Miltoncostaea marina TaxID=2843215 RepID=UPI001C3DDA30|nr:peptidoglycan DD-metalloendopeptidase family protein [Miltoncostaea marina]
MERASAVTTSGRVARRWIGALAVMAAVPAGASAAERAPELPPPPPPRPAPVAAPAPTEARVAAVSMHMTTRRAARPAPRLGPSLRLGARGPAVRELQRELRRRGIRVAVDGAFGPRTRRAVRSLQRRLGLRASGVADARVMRRLGLRVRAAAAAPRAVMRAGRTTSRLEVFPVRGEYSYSDTWGAPRSQGSHEGTDIGADRHTPLVAADDAVVSKLSRVETGLGGIYLWLRRADGIQYYYAHMQRIAAGLELGSRVSAGQVIGTVGNSGDARYGATHVHFEIRQNWTSMSPYRHLVAVDRDRA